ncbi:MAG: hypothetical protein C0404_14410 [Verrucomicrobia bacterium]|nr:hypothetical protein [Verrucomicrobiota bacterium]
MGRNRKRKLNTFMIPLPLAGVIVLLAAVALAYILLDCRCESLGSEIRAMEKESDALTRKCLNEEYKWQQMKTPRELERALQKFGISMTWPKETQIVRMGDIHPKENRAPREIGLNRVSKRE